MPGRIRKNFHDYWYGNPEVHLGDDVDDTPVNCWNKNGGLRKIRVDFLNSAFDLYTNAITNARKHSTRSKELEKEMHTCANAGYWMFGVTSLYDAFKHLEKYNAWSAEDTWGYHGTLVKKSDTSLYPTAAVSFLEKFEEINKDAVEACSKVSGQMEELLKYQEKGRDLTKQETRTVAEILEKIKKGSENAEKILWLSGRALDALEAQNYKGKLEAFVRIVDKCQNCAEAFTKGIGKVMKGVDLANEGTEVYNLYLENKEGMSEEAAVMLTLITRAVKLVPIFGEMYAAALEALPAVMTVAQEHADEIKLTMVRLGFEPSLY